MRRRDRALGEPELRPRVRLAIVTMFAALSASCDDKPKRPSPAAAATSPEGRSTGGGSTALASPHVSPPPPAPRPKGFLKGQLHMHTGRSMDSDTPPEVAVRWYAERGFDFVVITDHNTVTHTDGRDGMLVLPGIELTQNYRSCDPPPAEGLACLLHVTGLFVDDRVAVVDFPYPERFGRAELYERAVDRALGAGGLAMLNHPNFHYAADADLVVELAAHGVTLLEVNNEAVDSHNEGDATHTSTEELWDAALSRGARVFGTATDDAHHYDDAQAVRALGKTAYTGDRGFVMVRADKTPSAIRAAIERGDFYASTGALFDEVEMSATRVHVSATRELTFEVVGTRGAVLATSRGRSLDFDPTKAPRGYVRVRARDLAGHVAFTEPLFVP